jgi:hypothetical protein
MMPITKERKLWITGIALFVLLILLIFLLLYSSFDSGYREGMRTCLKTAYQNSSLFLPENPLLK